jgi:hypothetical protein
MDGDCTALTTVSGTVIVDEGDAAEGATVSWLGSTLSTTTDASGRFSFEVPVGNLFLQASKAGTWGSIELFWTEGASDLELDIVPDESFEEHFPGIDLDATKGVVEITFNNHSGMGGESATLSANGMSMSDELPPGPWPWLGFANVDVTDELTVRPMGAEGVNTCVLQVPGTLYPVRAKFLTGVEAMCTPL